MNLHAVDYWPMKVYTKGICKVENDRQCNITASLECGQFKGSYNSVHHLKKKKDYETQLPSSLAGFLVEQRTEGDLVNSSAQNVPQRGYSFRKQPLRMTSRLSQYFIYPPN